MNETLFKLISTYETLATLPTYGGPVRMEIFKSQDDQSLNRARIWLQGTYNLYPSGLNRDEKGGDLHRTHSEDKVDADMTPIICEDYTLVTGKHYASESDFVDYVKSIVQSYLIENKKKVDSDQ